MTHHEDNLREEWKQLYGSKEVLQVHSTYRMTKEIADWWLKNTIPTASLQALVEKMELLKEKYDDEDIHKTYAIAAYNSALSLCKAMVEELLTKENE